MLLEIVIGVLAIWLLLAVMYDAWPLVVLAVGIFLINRYTVWGSVTIFLTINALLVYEPIRDKKFSLTEYTSKLLPLSAKITAGIIVIALVVGAIFKSIDRSASRSEYEIPCSRSSPHGC